MPPVDEHHAEAVVESEHEQSKLSSLDLSDQDADDTPPKATKVSLTLICKPPVVLAKGPRKLKDPERKANTDAKLSETSGKVIEWTGKAVQPDADHKEAREDGHQCPNCNGWYNRPDHVRSHFQACVKKFGNPRGVVWNALIPTYGKRGAAKRRKVSESGKCVYVRGFVPTNNGNDDYDGEFDDEPEWEGFSDSE